MTATASAELIADIEAAISGGSPERRVLMPCSTERACKLGLIQSSVMVCEMSDLEV